MDTEAVRQLALSLPDVEEKDHWGKPSFRIGNTIFATLWLEENRAMLKLSLVDQSVFCGYDSTVFFPVPGGWGAQGATFVELKEVRRDMFEDALQCAYDGVAAKKKTKNNTRKKKS